MNKIITEDVEEIISGTIPFENIYGKTIFISGANGYVPAYFVHTFMLLNEKKNAKIKVLALCRNRNKADERFAEYRNRNDFKLIIQDVREPMVINEPIHIFIHAASPAGIKKRYDNPVNTFLANVDGVKNMLNLAVQNPCEHFLFISSVDVYGKLDDGERITEEKSGYLDTLNIRNSYSYGKRAAESLCKAYQVKYNLPVFIVRPFQIVGPGLELDDGRLHIDFISQIIRNNEIVLKSDGTAVRTFMYITDAVRAMFYVLFYGVPGEAYNIVMEEGEATVKELADLMASLCAEKSIKVVFDYAQRGTIEAAGALPVVTGSSSRLSALDWKPHYTIEDGAARMMQYYGIKTRGVMQ